MLSIPVRKNCARKRAHPLRLLPKAPVHIAGQSKEQPHRAISLRHIQNVPHIRSGIVLGALIGFQTLRGPSHCVAHGDADAALPHIKREDTLHHALPRLAT